VAKILTLLLGLVAIGLATVWYLNGGTFTQRQGSTAPKARLDDVREKARSIEDDAEKRMHDTLEKADGK
jgi:hypothetical protein